MYLWDNNREYLLDENNSRMQERCHPRYPDRENVLGMQGLNIEIRVRGDGLQAVIPFRDEEVQESKAPTSSGPL